VSQGAHNALAAIDAPYCWGAQYLGSVGLVAGSSSFLVLMVLGNSVGGGVGGGGVGGDVKESQTWGRHLPPLSFQCRPAKSEALTAESKTPQHHW
jgi:hypothetical protein